MAKAKTKTKPTPEPLVCQCGLHICNVASSAVPEVSVERNDAIKGYIVRIKGRFITSYSDFDEPRAQVLAWRIRSALSDWVKEMQDR